MIRFAAVLFLAAGYALAQTAGTAWVSRDFRVGLHEEKSVDSAITTLVNAGTKLELIKREDALSFVRAPDGATGWIDNSYLTAEAPSDSAELKQWRERSDVLERRLAEANDRIAELESRPAAGATRSAGDSASYQALKKQYDELEQKYKDERLRAGELQVQVTELRKHVGMNSGNVSLYEQIEQLREDNKKLEVALAAAGDAAPPAAGASRSATPVTMMKRNFAVWLGAALLAGIVAGIYLMDLLNRRRHGGFRV